IELVRSSVNQDPMMSLRRHVRELNMSRSSVARIQHRELHLRPYKLQVIHALKLPDARTRLIFCHMFERILCVEPTLTKRLLMGDEAHFDLSGGVYNRQNVRFWGTQQPHIIRE
ncbi:hypothetical protein EAI_05508, partial [Harpegnathos saltator]